MMFLTLLPILLEQADHVGILLSKRLVPIYQRSCQEWIASGQVSVWSHADAADGQFNQKLLIFNRLLVLLPVCCNRIENFSPKSPLLAAKDSRVAAFKKRAALRDVRPLRIGIS